MPHPERVFRNIQMSWTDQDPAAHSAWMQLWHNARKWVAWPRPARPSAP